MYGNLKNQEFRNIQTSPKHTSFYTKKKTRIVYYINKYKFLCLSVKISPTTEPIKLSILEKLHIDP